MDDKHFEMVYTPELGLRNFLFIAPLILGLVLVRRVPLAGLPVIMAAVFGSIFLQSVTEPARRVTVNDSCLYVRSNLSGKERQVAVSEIRSLEKGLFGHRVVKNQRGRTVLRLDQATTNTDKFYRWLRSYGVEVAE